MSAQTVLSAMLVRSFLEKSGFPAQEVALDRELNRKASMVIDNSPLSQLIKQQTILLSRYEPGSPQALAIQNDLASFGMTSPIGNSQIGTLLTLAQETQLKRISNSLKVIQKNKALESPTAQVLSSRLKTVDSVLKSVEQRLPVTLRSSEAQSNPFLAVLEQLISKKKPKKQANRRSQRLLSNPVFKQNPNQFLLNFVLSVLSRK